MTIGNTPRECDTSDTAINRLIEMENPNAGKQAIRYGREILMMHDRKVERWATVNQAAERLADLFDAGYFTAAAPTGDAISYREWLHCGPAEQRDATRYAAVDVGRDAPNELRALPAETDEEGLSL